MRAYRLPLSLALLALLAHSPASALAGGGGGGGPCAGFASGNTLVMLDSCFSGVAHFAEAGATLEVRNEGHLPHSFTAVDGSFDTGLLDGGMATEVKLGQAGIVEVYCVLHGRATGEGMAGIVVVGEPAVLGAGGGSSAADLTRQNNAILAALEAQSASLSDLQADLAAVRESQSAEARAAGPQPAQAAALGLLGTLLGGGALALVAYRRRNGAAPEAKLTAPEEQKP